jgi:hypothetical protein
MGWFPLGGAVRRSVVGGRPRGRGGRTMPGAGRGASVWVRAARASRGSGGLQRLVAEFARGVVAALEKLAGDGEAGAVAAEPFGRLAVVVAVGAALSAGRWGGLVERPARRRWSLAGEVAGRAAPVGLFDGDVEAGVADGVARGAKPPGVAELGEDRDRGQVADAVVGHLRPDSPAGGARRRAAACRSARPGRPACRSSAAATVTCSSAVGGSPRPSSHCRPFTVSKPMPWWCGRPWW